MASLPGNGAKDPSKWSALGWFALGVGFLIRAYYEWSEGGTVSGVQGCRASKLPGTVQGKVVSVDDSGVGEAPFVPPTGETLSDAVRRVESGPKPKVSTHTVWNIHQRVSYIATLAKKGGLDPQIRGHAMAVLTRKCGDEWCVKPKVWKAECIAMFNAITDPKSPLAVRYTRDHAKVDQFSSARRTLQQRGEDCDGLVVTLAALLLAVGYTPELVVMQAKGAKDWSHILLRVGKPGTGVDGGAIVGYTEWLILDPSMPEHPAGWAPPGLNECLESGKPAGICMKATTFQLG